MFGGCCSLFVVVVFLLSFKVTCCSLCVVRCFWLVVYWLWLDGRCALCVAHCVLSRFFFFSPLFFLLFFLFPSFFCLKYFLF